MLSLLLILQLAGTGGIGNGPSLPSTCVNGDIFVVNGTPVLYICTSSNTWSSIATGVGIPSGLITLKLSGTCDTGWTEVSSLNGKMLRGTVAANMDVGTSAGSDSITPTVNSLTAAAQVFSGSSANTSAVSAGTPSGTNGTGTVTPLGTNSTGTVTATGTINTPTISWPVGVPTFAGSALATHAHELPEQLVSNVLTRWIAAATFGTGTSRAAIGQVTATANTTSAAVALSQAVSAGTPAGTIAWPAGVPTSNSLTFTGSSATTSAQTFTGNSSVTSAEVFTGSALATHFHALTATGTNGTSAVTGTLNSFNNRPAYTNVIFCSKD